MSDKKEQVWMGVSLLAFILGFVCAFVLAKSTTFIDSKHITQQCVAVTALGDTEYHCHEGPYAK